MAKYIVQHRRGTKEQWNLNNTVIPKAGELVIEIDTENSLHKLKIGDGVHTYAELAYLTAGEEVVTQVLAQALPRVVTITLDIDKWSEIVGETDPNLGYYGQTIALENITTRSRLDLQPNADMLAEFKELDLVFVTENRGGQISVYSVGDMPLKSYTMQATITETEVVIDDDKIVGIPVGTPTLKADWTQTDDTKADYIKNKPTLGVLAAKDIVDKTDLSDDVQASLGKADTAIQSVEGLATEGYVDEKVSNLINSAPETLNTLNELAKALGNDENFATTVATQIGGKVDKEDGKVLSSNDFTDEEKTKLATLDIDQQHTHANKDILDAITSAPLTEILDKSITESKLSDDVLSLIDSSAITAKNSDVSDTSLIFNDLEGSYIGQNMFKILDIAPVITEVSEIRYYHPITFYLNSNFSTGLSIEPLDDSQYDNICRFMYTPSEIIEAQESDYGPTIACELYDTEWNLVWKGYGLATTLNGPSDDDGHWELRDTLTAGCPTLIDVLQMDATYYLTRGDEQAPISSSSTTTITKTIGNFEPGVAVTNGKYILDSVEGLEVGDIVSFKMDYNRYNWTEITDIDATTNAVGVSKFYNGEKFDGTGKGKTSFEGFEDGICTYDYIKTNLIDDDNAFLYVIDKPTVGGYQSSVNFSNVLGTGNRIAKAYAATVIGVNNLAAGNYTAIIGGNNKSGYGNYIIGSGNDALLSESNWILGRDNATQGNYNFVVASHSKTGSNSEYNVITGSRNTVEDNVKYSITNAFYGITGSSYQSVRGKYNVVDRDGKYADIFGGGTAINKRKNIYTLDWNGNAEFAGDVISKGTNITNSIDDLSSQVNSLDSRVDSLGNQYEPIIYITAENTITLTESGIYHIQFDKEDMSYDLLFDRPQNVNSDECCRITVYVQKTSTTSMININGRVLGEAPSLSEGVGFCRITAEYEPMSEKWYVDVSEFSEIRNYISEIVFPDDYPGTLRAETMLSNYRIANNLVSAATDRANHTITHLSPILKGCIMLPLSVSDVRNTSDTMVSFFDKGEYFRFKASKDGEVYVLSYKNTNLYDNSTEWEKVTSETPALPEGYSSWRTLPYDSVVTKSPYFTYLQWKGTVGGEQTLDTVSNSNNYYFAYKKSFKAGEQVVIMPTFYNNGGALAQAVFVKF